MFLGWFDPDKKRKITEKIVDAFDRYVEKFGEEPRVCLCSFHDRDDLFSTLAKQGRFVEVPPEEQSEKYTFWGMEMQAVGFIPRNTFYVGEEDAPEEELYAIS